VFFYTKIMKLITYIKEVKKEMKHVSWPTRKQAIVLTLITIAISLLVAVYLGALDYLFSQLLSKVV